jgi:hypothetical protein
MSNRGASKAAISFHYDLGNDFFDYFSIANVVTRVPCMTKSPILSKQLSNGNSSTTFIRRGPVVLPACSISGAAGARYKRGWLNNTE